MPCSGRQTRWDNAVRERCGQAPCTRRRTTPKCGRRILRSIKSVLIIQYDLLIPRDIERLRQRSAAGIVRAPAPRGDARKSVCPDWENSITAPRRGNTRPCPAENKTSCAPVSAAGTQFSPAEPLFLCGGPQKSRVKAEKTKIFFQKASSGFGDVSFKERSGRFKA